jgi:hypothetical protein
MKVLMSALIALSVLATLAAAPASATFQGSDTLKERLKNCFPASECQPS